jgi:hypothetical protein
MQLWKKVKNHFTPTVDNAYRPPALGRTSLIFFLGLTLAVEGFLAAGLVARESDGTFLSAVITSDIIDLTNVERVRTQLGLLHEDSRLDAAAQAKATDMASRGYFAHVSPDGTLPWMWITTSGYDYIYAGENLAVRFTESRDVVNAWMNSPSHRANILKPLYSDIGVGIANGMYKGQPATFVVQYFASSKTPAPDMQNAAALPFAPQIHTFVRSFSREMIKIVTDSSKMNWLLGSIAALFILLVCVSFILHIELQAHEMLLGGTIVAAVALLCLAANMHFITSQSSQTTTVIDATDSSDTQFSSSTAH